MGRRITKYGRLWRVDVRSLLRYGTPRKFLNALRTEWAFRRHLSDVCVRPYMLVVEPLYYCNLRCPLCARETAPHARKGKENAGRLPLDLFDQVLDEIGPYLFQCQIFGNGEPLLDWPLTSQRRLPPPPRRAKSGRRPRIGQPGAPGARRRDRGRPCLIGPATLNTMGASVERVGDGYRLSNELFDAVVSIAGDHVGIRIAATSAGKPLESKATPHRWHEEAGGWSWVLHEFILPPGAARVVLHIDAVRPKSVAITTEAWHATV